MDALHGEAPSFDPAAWVEHFKAVGGGFMDTCGSLHFCWVIEGKPLSDNIMARLLYKEVIGDPVKLGAVRDHIGRMMPEESLS